MSARLPVHILTGSEACPYAPPGYWSTFRAVLHTAYREHKIVENSNGFLERIDTIPTEKEHLSRQELVNLANTPCSSEVLKKALGFARPFSRSAE